MPATNDSTIVREIKELAKDSAASSEQAAQALSESQHAEDLKQFRDKLLDLALRQAGYRRSGCMLRCRDSEKPGF
jgi:hypothetical protein